MTPVSPAPPPTSPTYVALDFESFYDSASGYSLRNLTNIEYVRDPRFKSYGASVKIDGAPSVWMPHDQLVAWLTTIDPTKTAFVSHNAMFDAFVLAMHYGVVPFRYLCTLKMARYVLGQSIKGHNLAAVYEHLTGQPGKQQGDALAALDGVTNPTPAMLDALGEYARDDADECWAVFLALFPRMPQVEFDRLAWCIKMYTQPVLMLDSAKLEEVHTYEAEQKQLVLDEVGESGQTIRSRTQFPDLLKAAGLGSPGAPDVPMKISPTTGKETYAFAKSDKEFVDLMDLTNPDGTPHRIAQLVKTKLRVTSTIEETRARRLADVARRMGGYLPVPLNYCGAMPTNRLSGGQLLNLQNLGRGSKIRDAIVAPEGYVVVAADLSNIELRINMVNAFEHQAVADLAAGNDLYSKFASKVYGYTVVKGQHKLERQVGKVAELSLGYGSGWETYRQMLYDQADGMWISRQFAEATVATYRADRPYLKQMWNGFKQYLEAMEMGHGMANFTGAPVTLESDGMLLPSGFKIKYPNLRSVMATNQWGGVSKQFIYTRYAKDNPSGKGTIWYGQCLAGDTEVLTPTGWVPIVEADNQPVWDGEQFVRHDGLLYQGIKDTIVFNNVRLTPDHKVWDEGGWTPAGAANAERTLRQVQLGTFARPNRTKTRHSGSNPTTADTPEGYALAGPLRSLRQRDRAGLVGLEEAHGEGRGLFLPTISEEPDPRHEQTPGVRGVEVNARQVQTPESPSVGQLRGPWHTRLPAVGGELRELLGRHGADVPAGLDAGSGQQRGPLRARQLQVGYASGAEPEPTEHEDDDDWRGHGYSGVRVSSAQDTDQHSILPAGQGRRGGGHLPVYDLVNAGPNHRFMVRPAGGGTPFLVHNCVENLAQALAREVLADIQDRIRARTGVLPALQVHDELVFVVHESLGQWLLDICLEEMARTLPWWPALPLAAEGAIGKSYGDAK